MAERLAVVPTGTDRFVSAAPMDRHHVFGGLLVAQALRAATATVGGGRAAHAVHASFVSAGAPEEPMHYRVERTRDGASFSTRHVTATQAHGTVIVLTADFHHDEPGPEYQQPARPGIPGPEGLAPGRYDNPVIESRDVPVDEAPGEPAHSRRAWFRARATIGDDPGLHLQTLAYLSDFGATRAAREPHAHLADDARRQSVSLDHSLWFHRPVDASQWLLSELTPVATGRGRGLALGSIRTEDGDLAVTIAQEVMLRDRSDHRRG